MKGSHMMKYAPIPFWFLNHRLEEQELRRQLKLFKESGVSGFFMHPRAGLLTPYGSKGWFDMIEWIVREAKKLGLDAWLYDDDPFPIGAAGGILFYENPAFRAKRLAAKTFVPDENGLLSAELGQVHVLSAVAVHADDSGNLTDVVDVTSHIGVLRKQYHKTNWNSSYYCDWIRDVPNPHVRAETFFPELVLETTLSPGYKVIVCYAETVLTDDKHGFLPDNLNPLCVKRFIELTHEKYQERVGEEFSKTIPGIFTDEPSAGGILPWTDRLPEIFAQKNGYDLLENIFHVFGHFGERSRTVREDYWNTVSAIYEESFFGQISDWCKAKGLRLTGHVLSEEDPVSQVFNGAGVHSLMKFFDIPGFDIICSNLGNLERPALMAGAKLVSSAAHQQGKKQVLCEAFACNAFNFDYAGLLRITNWLFALGMTLIVPHGFYYSVDGNRKFDAGKSFFFQDPYFAEFPKYADYCSKTGKLLAEAPHESNTALVCPMSLFRRYLPAEEEKAFLLRSLYFRTVATLIANHIEFDIIDEDALSQCEVSGGEILCGQESFRTILCFAPTPVLHLDKKVHCFVISEHEDFDLTLLKSLAVRTEISGVNTENLLVNRKRVPEGTLLFIFNNSNLPSHFTIQENKNIYAFDSIESKYYKVRGEILLNGYDSIILILTDRQYECGLYENPAEIPKREYGWDLCPQWDYAVPGAVAQVDDWTVTIGDRLCGTFHFAGIRDIAGTELSYLIHPQQRPIFDKAPRVPSVYPVEARFCADFQLDDVDEPLYLLLEGSTLCGCYEIRINGHGLGSQKFQKRFVYDFTNIAADITPFVKRGRNEIEIRFHNANEFDGIYSSVYIMKENQI